MQEPYGSNGVSGSRGYAELSGLNVRGSTECELVGADDLLALLLCGKCFTEAQRHTT